MNLHMNGSHSVGDFLFLYFSIAMSILAALLFFQVI